MISHTTRRRAALLSALTLPALFAVSCAPRSRPAVSKPLFHPAAPLVAAQPLLPARPKTPAPIAFPDLNTSEISSLTFSPNGRRLAFGYGTDAEVTLWNLQTGRLAWQRHVDAASGGPIQFGPKGDFLVAQFYDSDSDTPMIVSSVSGQLIRNLGSLQADGTAKLEPGGHFFVAQGSHVTVASGAGLETDHTVQQIDVWNTRTWRRTDHKVSVHPGEHTYSPPELVMLTSSGIIVHHAQAQKDKWPPAPFNAYDQQASNNDFFVKASDEGTKGRIEAWDIRLKKRLWTQAIADVPRVPAISPDGKILAVPTLQGNVYFWNLKTGQLFAKTQCSNDVLRCAAFSPNGYVLAVAGGGSYYNTYYKGTDGVRLLDTKTFKLIVVLKSSFPGQFDRTGKIWSLDHPDWFASLPDLSYIASVGVVKKIRTPGRARDAKIVAQFERPERVRAALRRAWN